MICSSEKSTRRTLILLTGEPKAVAGATPPKEPIARAALPRDGAPSIVLLDTLPDRFTVTPRMMYSHFARYDFNFVEHHPEGKRRVALLRQIALNLLTQEKSAKIGMKAKRKKAGWDDAYLCKVLAQ